MEFKQFTEEIQLNVKDLLGPDKEVLIQYNLKNNDQNKCGIVIREKGQPAVLTIYLEAYYEEFLDGRDIEPIVDDIILLSVTSPIPKVDGKEILTDFHKCKSKILYRLVGTYDNEKFLSGCPHDSYLDMAKVYYVLLNVNEYGCLSMLVQNEHLKAWGVTLKDLQIYAKVNTCREMPVKFSKASKIIAEDEITLGQPLPKSHDFMYLLTNEHSHYGASVLLYDGVVDMIYQELGMDYYVIPSSVHEVFIIPAIPGIMDINQVIKGGNEDLVDGEEILSYSGYHYIHGEGLKIYS